MTTATSAGYAPLASAVIAALGGADNIRTVTHCATRLRFVLKDSSKADMAAVEGVEGVIAALRAGGQHQVVIGNDVPLAFAAVTAEPGMAAHASQDDGDSPHGGTGSADEGEKTNLFNRFITMISALFNPVVSVLAGVAIGKAFVQMALQFGWLDAESGTAIVLSAAVDGVFYFLPLFLAITAARRFGVNQFTAMAVVAPLLHPTIVQLAATEGAQAFRMAFPAMSYASSVIPAILAVWVAGYLQRGLDKVLPSAVRNFLTPLFVVVIMVPVVLFTIGPATTWFSGVVADGVKSLFVAAPWLAGALLGGLWQVFVMFGLHWGFVPIFLNDLATAGQEQMYTPILVAVLAQGAATLAVMVASRNAQRRKLAGPAALSGILAGVTEPAIYGVNLPLKYPFAMGIAGGAVGGTIATLGGAAGNSFVFPSVLALPAYLEFGGVTMLLIGTGVGMVIAFVGTLVTLRHAERADAAPADAPLSDATPAAATAPAAPATTATTETAAGAGSQVTLGAPVAGTVVALADVPDKVFASAAMGQGLAIEPADGTVVAPVAGQIIAAPKSGHAVGLRTDDGVEVLIHVGLGTVAMKGEGFALAVARGDRVAAGDVLCRVDLQAIAAAGHPATTIMVVTNTAAMSQVIPVADGEVAAGAAAVDVEK